MTDGASRHVPRSCRSSTPSPSRAYIAERVALRARAAWSTRSCRTAKKYAIARPRPGSPRWTEPSETGSWVMRRAVTTSLANRRPRSRLVHHNRSAALTEASSRCRETSRPRLPRCGRSPSGSATCAGRRVMTSPRRQLRPPLGTWRRCECGGRSPVWRANCTRSSCPGSASGGRRDRWRPSSSWGSLKMRFPVRKDQVGRDGHSGVHTAPPGTCSRTADRAVADRRRRRRGAMNRAAGWTSDQGLIEPPIGHRLPLRTDSRSRTRHTDI